MYQSYAALDYIIIIFPSPTSNLGSYSNCSETRRHHTITGPMPHHVQQRPSTSTDSSISSQKLCRTTYPSLLAFLVTPWCYNDTPLPTSSHGTLWSLYTQTPLPMQWGDSQIPLASGGTSSGLQKSGAAKAKTKYTMSINALEYAALIINYVVALMTLLLNPRKQDPFPSLLLFMDNVASKAWIIKGAKQSKAGRFLDHLQ